MRMYLDTSVFGGYFELQFVAWTKKLIDGIIAGKDVAVISDLTLREIATAPKEVRSLVDRVLGASAELVELTEEAERLADCYVRDKVVSPRYRADALHIAVSTLNRVDVLVSWNFQHIVNLSKIRMFNAVNLRLGYPMLEIRSPQEVAYES